MADYVINSWKAQDAPIEGSDEYVRIKGRAGGLLSWLLTLVKISPSTSLVVSADKITFEEGSLAGSLVFHTPLENTSSTFYGYTKPWKAAVAIGIALGVVTWFLLFIPGIIAGLLYYYLKMTLTVGYNEIGGQVHAISFQRSVIEGQKIDEAQAAKVCAIIQTLVDARRSRVGA